MWKMFQAENAIEIMGVQIRFSEPLPYLVSNRMLRALEPVTSAAGLINRQPVQSINIDMQNPNAPVKTVGSKGMVFQKTSLLKVNGEVVNQLASQIESQPTHVGYATWMYKSWTKEKQTIHDLLRDALKIATQSVAIAAIRIEYTDRFVFDGDANVANVNDLLNGGSNLFAPQILDAPHLFHSHTGRFADVTDVSRRLHMVNIDAQELTFPVHYAGRRSISALTAVEDQFISPGLEITSENAIDSVMPILDDLHNSALDLFKQIINQDFRDKNGLPA